MRRESQQIIPNLYLGPFQASINLDKLQALGITHMWVSVGACTALRRCLAGGPGGARGIVLEEAGGGGR
jgi:hypothetical protein